MAVPPAAMTTRSALQARLELTNESGKLPKGSLPQPRIIASREEERKWFVTNL